MEIEDFTLFSSTLDFIPSSAIRMEHGGRIFCVAGNATVKMNGNTYFLVRNASLAILPNCALEVIERSDDFNTFIFAYTRQFFHTASKDLPGIIPLYIQHPYIIRSDREANFILSTLAMLKEISSEGGNIYRIEMAQCILRFFLMGIMEQSPENESSVTFCKHEYGYFSALLYQLSLSYKKRRTVRFYADLLSITPKHLNNVCRSIAHETAKDTIDQYVITQLSNDLRMTNKTIEELALEFNFIESSMLCRYFKKHIGMTPKEYREQMIKRC